MAPQADVMSPGWVVLGRAVTKGQVLPLGIDDPVVAARAVRRALAQAQRRAVDVTALAIASPMAVEASALADFARRALGSHGVGIGLSATAPDGTATADSLAESAADHMAVSDLISHGVGIAVGLDADGTTVALCVQRPKSRCGP